MSQVESLSFDNFPFMTEIDGWQGQPLELDVLPHVHLRPVAQWKDAKMFADVHFTVEEIPQLRPLVFGIPLAEFVPM